MNIMRFLTILAWVFAIIFSVITAFRMYQCARLGVILGDRAKDPRYDDAFRAHGFIIPLIIAVICWAFIIAT